MLVVLRKIVLLTVTCASLTAYPKCYDDVGSVLNKNDQVYDEKFRCIAVVESASDHILEIECKNRGDEIVYYRWTGINFYGRPPMKISFDGNREEIEGAEVNPQIYCVNNKLHKKREVLFHQNRIYRKGQRLSQGEGSPARYMIIAIYGAFLELVKEDPDPIKNLYRSFIRTVKKDPNTIFKKVNSPGFDLEIVP